MHFLVATYLGYKPPLEAPAPGTVREDPDVGELLGHFGGEIPIRRMDTPIDSAEFDAAMAQKSAREAAAHEG